MANNTTDIQNLQKAKKFGSDVKREAEGAAGDLKSRAENVRNDFTERFQNAGQTVREYSGQLKEKASDAVDYIEREARTNPLRTASVAFVTGFIAALILGRR